LCRTHGKIDVPELIELLRRQFLNFAFVLAPGLVTLQDKRGILLHAIDVRIDFQAQAVPALAGSVQIESNLGAALVQLDLPFPRDALQLGDFGGAAHGLDRLVQDGVDFRTILACARQDGGKQD
jgi:hypothetical protein